MSYEFNPDTSASELPNPYKVENLCLFLAAAIAVACSAVLLRLVYVHLVASFDARGVGALALASALLLLGISLAWFACTQLKFLFGRGRPASLAQELGPNEDGASPWADYYKETLRQNAIQFAEPRGALNGLLYAWLPDLIFAPAVARVAAQKLFHSFLSLAAILASFLVCWGVASATPGAGWIGLIYAAIAAPMLLRPLRRPLQPMDGDTSQGSTLATAGLVGMIILAVIGPVVIAKLATGLPALGDFSINGVLAVSLVCALSGSVVFGLALKHQLQPVPQAMGVARVQDTLTINTHPSKLLEELDRLLMERWLARIPNRKYSRRSPAVRGHRGTFLAEVFEETQPRPQADRVAAGIAEAFAKPYFRWLAALTVMAALFMGSCAVSATLAGRALLQGEPFATALMFAISQLAVSLFCFRAAHVLWGRFDFVSEMVWVDFSGSYEAARVNVGNQFAGSLHTSKNVINVEAMTMRVWVSEIDTVVFGKDAPRQLIGMRGLQARADDLARALRSFGEAQSMVVAPRSSEDLNRAASVAAANRAAAGSLPSPDAQRIAAGALAQESFSGDADV